MFLPLHVEEDRMEEILYQNISLEILNTKKKDHH